MKKLLLITMCLIASVLTVNGHNVHYPTYTEDGFTYVKAGVSDAYIDGQWYEQWDIKEINKPNNKTITIPYIIEIDGKKVKVRNINDNAFLPCVSLDSLIISDGFYLNCGSFVGCKKLEYLYYSSNSSAWSPKLPKNYPNLYVKTLETKCGVLDESFWNSEGIKNHLEKLIIKDDSKGFFSSIDCCEKLKTIVCYATNPPKARGTKNVYSYSCSSSYVKFNSKQWSTITLYVPKESLEKYYFDGTWGEIDNIYTIDEMNNNVTSAIEKTDNDFLQNNDFYYINGTKTNNPTKGIYIKNGKKYYYH